MACEQLIDAGSVLIPEISVDEHDFLFRPENKVRHSGQVFVVQPVAEAHVVHDAPYDQFRLCVAAADFLHIP